MVNIYSYCLPIIRCVAEIRELLALLDICIVFSWFWTLLHTKKHQLTLLTMCQYVSVNYSQISDAHQTGKVPSATRKTKF